jgi:hypothetical protein
VFRLACAGQSKALLSALMGFHLGHDCTPHVNWSIAAPDCTKIRTGREGVNSEGTGTGCRGCVVLLIWISGFGRACYACVGFTLVGTRRRPSLPLSPIRCCQFSSSRSRARQ